MIDAPDELARAIEAALFASDQPMSVEALAAHLGDAPPASLRAALAALADDYAPRGIHLVERGGRWHFETAADLAHILRREREHNRRLSRAATEVLAIVAYGGGMGPARRAARSPWAAGHLCHDARLSRSFRARKPSRPAGDRGIARYRAARTD